MLELTFATKDMIESKGKGRSFNCKACPTRTQKLRQCGVDRWDFTEEDNPSVFPIQVYEGGTYYGFCPAKAFWPGPDSIVEKFKGLLYAASSNNMWSSGGLEDQPAWFIDTMSWFKPIYDQVIFSQRMRSVIGNGKIKKAASRKTSTRGVPHGNRGLHR